MLGIDQRINKARATVNATYTGEMYQAGASLRVMLAATGRADEGQHPVTTKRRHAGHPAPFSGAIPSE